MWRSSSLSDCRRCLLTRGRCRRESHNSHVSFTLRQVHSLGRCYVLQYNTFLWKHYLILLIKSPISYILVLNSHRKCGVSTALLNLEAQHVTRLLPVTMWFQIQSSIWSHILVVLLGPVECVLAYSTQAYTWPSAWGLKNRSRDTLDEHSHMSHMSTAVNTSTTSTVCWCQTSPWCNVGFILYTLKRSYLQIKHAALLIIGEMGHTCTLTLSLRSCTPSAQMYKCDQVCT